MQQRTTEATWSKDAPITALEFLSNHSWAQQNNYTVYTKKTSSMQSKGLMIHIQTDHIVRQTATFLFKVLFTTMTDHNLVSSTQLISPKLIILS